MKFFFTFFLLISATLFGSPTGKVTSSGTNLIVSGNGHVVTRGINNVAVVNGQRFDDETEEAFNARREFETTTYMHRELVPDSRYKNVSDKDLQKLCQNRYEQIPTYLRRGDGKVVVNEFGQVCSQHDVMMSVHASNTVFDEVEDCHYADGLEAMVSGLRGDYRGCSVEEDPKPMPVCGKEHLQLMRENLDQNDVKEFDRHQMLQELSEATLGLKIQDFTTDAPRMNQGFDRSCEPIELAFMPVEREHEVSFDGDITVDSTLKNRLGLGVHNFSGINSSFTREQVDQNSLRLTVMQHSLRRLTSRQSSFSEKILSSGVTSQQILYGNPGFSSGIQSLEEVKLKLGR
jgi:hypothetical protein